MRHFQNAIKLFLLLILGLTLYLTFEKYCYIQNEGFNPSDDGVILAQAYRMLVFGEVPHKDFISIRPVLSGIIHTIHFVLPLPLMESARWFTLFEYFLYSTVWVWLLFNVFKISNRIKELFFLVLAIIASFLLNVNHFVIYPWTTIDGITIITIGMCFILPALACEKIFLKTLFYCISLFVFSLAALTKQNFIIVSVASLLILTYHYYNIKRINYVWMFLLAWILPLLIYVFYMIYYNSLGVFFEQISGRDEFITTAILYPVLNFIKSDVLFIHLFVLSLLIIYILNLSKTYIRYAAFTYKLFFAFAILYLILTIFLSFKMLISDIPILLSISIELFWILVVLFIMAIILNLLNARQTLLLGAVLLVSWSSLISKGANSPVFMVGTISVAIIFISLKIINDLMLYVNFRYKYLLEFINNWFVFCCLPLSIVIFYIAQKGQQEFNYRDLSSKQLSCCLCRISDNFGTIKTNSTTYSYLSDLINIYNLYDDMWNNFVVIPNNAIIYPILNSRNPFPLDWLQHDEFIGSEKYLQNKINIALKQKSIYLIIDKYDSKNMAYELTPKIYDPQNYPYYPYLISRSEHLLETEYFKVYKTK